MEIVRIAISNYRCIREALIYPAKCSALLGPNNIGKTAVLEALNLALNPEMGSRWKVVDENDFHERGYLPPADLGEVPRIRIELVIAGMTEADENTFREHLVPWRPDKREVVESTPEGADPFADADPAIRVVFESWYDPEEDEFQSATYFLPEASLARDQCAPFTRQHKRHIGFLIYRDFRALTRPITLEYGGLFSTLLRSQQVQPKHLEEALSGVREALAPMANEPDFEALLDSYRSELERFLPLEGAAHPALRFELTDLTRDEVKADSQLYVSSGCGRPIQKLGAGSRSLALLSILTLIMRKRQGGILALEEPETFLYPHAQRRVTDECLRLASQLFVTTHSPFVLERVPVEGVGRVINDDGRLTWKPLSTARIKEINLYSKRLRQTHCEALMGRGVIVVEGDSDRWWLTGTGSSLNDHDWCGRRQEALELQGIAVVSADGNGEIHRLCRFFHESGLRTVALFDDSSNVDLLRDAMSAEYLSLFLQATGLEDLLAKRLPTAVLQEMLCSAPHAKASRMGKAAVTALSESEVRSTSRRIFIDNKGSGAFHMWLIDKLGPSDFPGALRAVCDTASRYVSQGEHIGVSTILC